MFEPRRTRALAINVGLAVVSLLAVMVFAEVALRVVLSRGLNPFEPDPELGYRLKRGFEGVYPRVRVRTDDLGRRVPLDQEQDATGRWLFLGDSVTFGFGVAASEAFPWLIAEQLGEPTDATVAAVPGYNLDQAVASAAPSLEARIPDLVVMGLVINDPTGAANPAEYRDIDPHAAGREEGGWLGRSMLWAFVQRRLRRITASFDPPPERTGSLAEFRDLDAELDDATLAAFDRQWSRLEELQSRLERPVYVLVCPFRQQVEDESVSRAFQRFATRRCAAGPLVCLDPLPAFRERADEGLFNGESAFHYNERGHALMARWLLENVPWRSP